MFTSTREYKTKAGSALDALPSCLSAIVLDYVSTPGADIWAHMPLSILQRRFSVIEIVDAALVPGFRNDVCLRPYAPRGLTIELMFSFWANYTTLAAGVVFLHMTGVELWDFLSGDNSLIGPMILPILAHTAPGREEDILAEMRAKSSATFMTLVDQPTRNPG